MNNQQHLDPFRNSDGSTSHTGQTQAGAFEKQQGWQSSQQQSWEPRDAYDTRVDAYHNHRKGS